MQTKEYRQEMKSFYNSKAWKDCRNAYIRKKAFICERCGQATGKMIVHHKIYLTPELALDPSVSLNFDNLECLCIDCHNSEHFGENFEKRYTVDEFGRVIPSP